MLLLLSSPFYNKETEVQSHLLEATSHRAGYIPGLTVILKTSLASTAPRAAYVGHDLLIPAPGVSPVHSVADPRWEPVGPTPQPVALPHPREHLGGRNQGPCTIWGEGVR